MQTGLWDEEEEQHYIRFLNLNITKPNINPSPNNNPIAKIDPNPNVYPNPKKILLINIILKIKMLNIKLSLLKRDGVINVVLINMYSFVMLTNNLVKSKKLSFIIVINVLLLVV